MDIFGKRFEKELEQMKRDVAKWQNSPGASATSAEGNASHDRADAGGASKTKEQNRRSVDQIPLLDDNSRSSATVTGARFLDDANGSVYERR